MSLGKRARAGKGLALNGSLLYMPNKGKMQGTVGSLLDDVLIGLTTGLSLYIFLLYSSNLFRYLSFVPNYEKAGELGILLFYFTVMSSGLLFRYLQRYSGALVLLVEFPLLLFSYKYLDGFYPASVIVLMLYWLYSKRGSLWSTSFASISFLAALSLGGLKLSNISILSIVFLLVPYSILKITEKKNFFKGICLEYDKSKFWKHLALGVALGVATFVFSNMVLAPLADTRGFLPSEGEGMNMAAQFSVFEWLVIFALASITEEIMFRGFLNKRIGVLASSVVFALFHLGTSTFSAINAFCMGIIFSVVVSLAGALAPVVVAHYVYNAIVISGIVQQLLGMVRI